MLALLLLKGLSTFEYSLRDKTITFEEVLLEDYDSNEGKGFLKSLRSGGDVHNFQTIDLGKSDSTLSPISISQATVESQDSGYIEIKYRAELNPKTSAEFVIEDKLKVKHSVLRIEENKTEFEIMRSDLFQLSQFAQLLIVLSKEESGKATQDSLKIAKAYHLGYVYLDYMKLIAKVEQRPAF